MLRYLPAVIVLATASCGLPRDPEGSSKRIAESHILRAGATDNKPWVSADNGEPQGVEPDLVRQFAAQQGARVQWTRGSETNLAEALRNHELDLAVGGFDKKTKWAAEAGVSQPYAETADKKKHVFLTAAGENALTLALDRFLTAKLRASKGQG